MTSKSRKKLGQGVLFCIGMLLCAGLLFPYIVMLTTALKPYAEIYTIPPRWLPDNPKPQNFFEVWSAAPIARYMLNSTFVAGASTILAMLVGIPAGYAVARLNFPGRQAFVYLVLGLRMFAPVVLLVGLYRLLSMLNLVDNLWALVFINAAFNQAFTVWILSGYFSTIPRELEDAAWIDGCSRWQALFRVVIPVAAPGIVTATIFVFIAAWNEFPIALTLISSPDLRVLPVGIYGFIGQYFVHWQYLFAASLYAIVPVILLFALIEKYLVTGLTAGAIK